MRLHAVFIDLSLVFFAVGQAAGAADTAADARHPLDEVGVQHALARGLLEQAGQIRRVHLKMVGNGGNAQLPDLPRRGGRLSIGLRPVMLSQGLSGADIDTEESNDPAFPTSDVKGTAFDLDAGIRFSYRQTWYVGLSAMHCLSPTVSLGDDKSYQVEMAPTLYLTGGYRLPLRDRHYAIATAAAFRTDMQDWRADVTARLLYEGSKHKMYGGLSYSPTRSVTVLLGIDFHGINVGYAYEIYTGGIGALHGTHELVLGYQTDLNLFKKGKNKHKSVRLL